MKNNCKNINKLLSAYLDNELDIHDITLVKEHLSSCGQCRHELKKLNQITLILKAKKSIEPPAYLEKRIISSIEGIPLKRGFLWKIAHSTAGFLPVFTAVSLALLFIFNLGKNELPPVYEYIYDAMTVENNELLFEKALLAQDDELLDIFFDL